MPNLPISQLPQSTTLQGDELFVDVQGGVTKYTTLDDVTGYVTGSIDYITPAQTGSLVNTTYGLYNQTGSYTAISQSTAETNIIGGGVGTLSVPAGGFQQGQAYQLTVTGTGTFHNNDTLDIHVETAAGVHLTRTGAFTIANASDTRWKLDINFSIHQIGPAGTAAIVSAGTFMYTKNASTQFEGVNFGTENSTTFDTTVDNTLTVKATFSSALNVLTTRLFTLHKIY